MSNQLLQQILALDPTEQARIVEKVWDSLLRENPDATPIPVAQRGELDTRLKRYHDRPHPGTPADEVFARLRAKYSE